MRRSKLMSLEKQGLVQETYGYGRSLTLDGDLPPSEDPAQDEKLRTYMLSKARNEAQARARRISRLRLLARMDYKLLGGVAPTGFNGGAGGSDALFRSSSMGARG